MSTGTGPGPAGPLELESSRPGDDMITGYDAAPRSVGSAGVPAQFLAGVGACGSLQFHLMAEAVEADGVLSTSNLNGACGSLKFHLMAGRTVAEYQQSEGTWTTCRPLLTSSPLHYGATPWYVQTSWWSSPLP